MVFNASGTSAESEAVFEYARYAWYNSATATYRTVLKIQDDVNLYFMANAKDMVEGLIASGDITKGMAFAAVREKLLLKDPHLLTNDNLPMSGHLPGKSITESATYLNLGTVKLLRSVASTDISVTSTDFELEQAHVAYGTSLGYLAYNSGDLMTGKISTTATPRVPSAAGRDIEWAVSPSAFTAGEPSYEVQNKLYMYENDADGTGTSRYTKLVLQGRYKDGDATYYPIAFRDDDTNEKIQVARNHKFSVTVTKVNGDGYVTIDRFVGNEKVIFSLEEAGIDGYPDGQTIDTDGNLWVAVFDGYKVIKINPRKYNDVLETVDIPAKQVIL